MKLSVAIAAYNGEGYILEQLASVLNQLGETDEVVVSVDPCKDNTFNIVSALSELDGRVKPLEGKGEGLIKNFENAINACTGDIIFLADQDDKWMPDKVSTVLKHFTDGGADLVLHNCSVADSRLNVEKGMESFFDIHGSKPGYKNNIIKNSYMGCCMAFRKELRREFLPFPENIPMHDQWIGLMAEKCGAKIVFEQKPLLLYRRHGKNVSDMKHDGIFTMIKRRLDIIKALKNIDER